MRLSPSGVGGVRVQALGALFPAAIPVTFPVSIPVTFPAAPLAAMELACQALRTTHQAREAVRTGGARGCASRLRVAVALSTGSGALRACAGEVLSWRRGRGWAPLARAGVGLSQPFSTWFWSSRHGQRRQSVSLPPFDLVSKSHGCIAPSPGA